MPETPKIESAMTLRQFNARIKDVLNFTPELQSVWVTAETSDVQVRRGHCYMDLIEKDVNGTTVARIGAVAWASIFGNINAKFHAATGMSISTGMKVMVRVSVNFHEQYGLKVLVTDISPEYTLGDMERQRREILERLTREGVIDNNRQIPWPIVPQRIAVISAAGAAGYGDFVNQLTNNSYGIKYYTALFSAMMQGANTAPSVIRALERIAEHQDKFDCVVIIRGGGATSDLNSFDNYELALNVALFPLPIVVGIGHDRDKTVLDSVACRPVKTPTAAAELLIHCGMDALSHLNEIKENITTAVRESIALSQRQLAYIASNVPTLAQGIVERNKLHLKHLIEVIPLRASGRIQSEDSLLRRRADAIVNSAKQLILKENMRIEALDGKVKILSPRATLNRGYTLTLLNGRVVTDSTQLGVGAEIVSHFKQGSVHSIVKSIRPGNKQ